MRMKNITLAALLISATLHAGPASAECLNAVIKPETAVENAILEYDSFPGASRYYIEAYDEEVGGWIEIGDTSETAFILPDLNPAADRLVQLRVIPANPFLESFRGCLERVTWQVESDNDVRKQLGRLIVPAVGSLPGAFDSQWRTILSLSNNTTEDVLQGRIVFHPAGKIASDDDPSIPYSLQPGEVVQWSDIVLAIGGSGMGSLDIIPTEVSQSSEVISVPVPEVQARVVNDSPEGTYGTDVPEIFLLDLVPNPLGIHHQGETPLAPRARGVSTSITLPADYEHVRINVGARYLDLVDRYRVEPTDPKGTPFLQLALRRDGKYIEVVWRENDPGYIEQFPLEEIFETQLVERDVVVIRSISALVYWTLNDNRTNDPAFVYDNYVATGDRLLVY